MFLYNSHWCRVPNQQVRTDPAHPEAEFQEALTADVDFLLLEHKDETPGAKKLHGLQAKLQYINKDKATELISKWLLPREANHDLSGEEFIAVANNSNLNKEYLKHAKDETLDLEGSKPDRIIGFVPFKRFQDLKSVFDEAAWEVMQRFMDIPLNREACFAFITADFKSAEGKSISYTTLQQAHAGIAANNYMRKILESADIDATELDTVHFGIVCDTITVVLYMHWSDSNGSYYMKQVFATLIAAAHRHKTVNDDMVKMRGYIRNMVKWAKDARVTKTKEVVAITPGRLDAEEAAKKQAAQAQSQALDGQRRDRDTFGKDIETVTQRYW
ncbi:hypothetical protein N0V86_008377 [Didymella sp. IMI 355093]|nr:hypothetical protein N0V86_008377 [Didymella sp. IMI 355093]